MDIQTFVFFDLETTGLIQENVMPRITEIALVAVSTESIRNGNKNCLPRVLHKLVLPVNPQKVIPVQVQHMTKLYNEDMQVLQPFKSELYELIIYFLQRLTPPICFAAHNGNKFDYPIFLEELKRINKILSDEILCIDTWKMFDDFFKKRNLQSTVFQDLLNDEFNDSLSTLDMDVVTKESKIIAMTSTAQTMLLCDDKYIKAVNTKVDSCNNDVDVQSSKNPIQVANEKTPKAQKTKPENVFMQRPVKKNNLKKRLNFEEKIEFERPSSLKLIAIHEHIVGKHFEEHHSAEADCLAMIRCVSNIVDFFLDWSNNHAIPLTYCKKKI
ncbi:TREX2 exonuclease, partial [Acromyrmex insinuator]